MKAIVFGGAGFLGSHVADALTEKGFDVVIYDRIKSPYPNFKQTMIIGDVLDERLVSEAVRGCDIVYNFAGVSDIEEALQKPMETVKVNIIGNTIILEACLNAKNIKRFIYASSLYVYGKSASFYRSTKQACELLIENYNEVFGLPYTILRYGSIYGPRAYDKNYICKILKQALREGKIVREGDGEEIREYIHVLDAAKGSIEILSAEFENQYVTVTGSQQMKVKDLLVMIREIFDNKVEIEYKPISKNFHYEITPYVFAPKVAKKLVSKTYFDLGQGILSYIQDIYNKISPDCGNQRYQ